MFSQARVKKYVDRGYTHWPDHPHSPPPPQPNGCCSRRYESYWNALLFFDILTSPININSKQNLFLRKLCGIQCNGSMITNLSVVDFSESKNLSSDHRQDL